MEAVTVKSLNRRCCDIFSHQMLSFRAVGLGVITVLGGVSGGHRSLQLVGPDATEAQVLVLVPGSVVVLHLHLWIGLGRIRVLEKYRMDPCL